MTAPDAHVSIRRLGVADAAAFRALRLEAIAGEPTAFSAALEDERAKPAGWAVSILAEDAPTAVFGALSGPELIGMAGLAMQTGRKLRHKATLWSVYVRPGFRHAGIGRTLLATAIRYAASRTLVLQASVAVDNRPALTLYESMGFVRYGLEPKALCIDRRFHDDALLWLDLTRAEP